MTASWLCLLFGAMLFTQVLVAYRRREAAELERVEGQHRRAALRKHYEGAFGHPDNDGVMLRACAWA
jgi:hypothetical protein